MVVNENAEIRIEIARAVDAEAINEVHREAWLKAYVNLDRGITREDIEDRFADVSEERMMRRRKFLSHPDEGMVTLVARDGSRVVGDCRVIKYPDHNSLQMIYILPEFQKQGLGTRLWDEAKKHIDLSRDTQVEVVDYNLPAISFYEKLGFQDTGKRIQSERFRMKSGGIFTEMEMVLKGA